MCSLFHGVIWWWNLRYVLRLEFHVWSPFVLLLISPHSLFLIHCPPSLEFVSRRVSFVLHLLWSVFSSLFSPTIRIISFHVSFLGVAVRQGGRRGVAPASVCLIPSTFHDQHTHERNKVYTRFRFLILFLWSIKKKIFPPIFSWAVLYLLGVLPTCLLFVLPWWHYRKSLSL